MIIGISKVLTTIYKPWALALWFFVFGVFGIAAPIYLFSSYSFLTAFVIWFLVSFLSVPFNLLIMTKGMNSELAN